MTSDRARAPQSAWVFRKKPASHADFTSSRQLCTSGNDSRATLACVPDPPV